MTLCLHGSRVQPHVAKRMTIICSLRADHSQTQSYGPSDCSRGAEIVLCCHGKVLSSTACASQLCLTVQTRALGAPPWPAGSTTAVRGVGRQRRCRLCM